jgi:hypothetical protein
MFTKTLQTAEAPPGDAEIKWMEYMKMLTTIQGQILACDKALMVKRKMLLEIERESVMTILAALRAIPKQPPKEEESPMAKYLREKREKQSG